MAVEVLNKPVENLPKIGIILESPEDLTQRRRKSLSYYIRRWELASGAADDRAIRRKKGPAQDAVNGFLVLTTHEPDNFNPESIRRKRWLKILGAKIPLSAVQAPNI